MCNLFLFLYYYACLFSFIVFLNDAYCGVFSFLLLFIFYIVEINLKCCLCLPDIQLIICATTSFIIQCMGRKGDFMIESIKNQFVNILLFFYLIKTWLTCISSETVYCKNGVS